MDDEILLAQGATKVVRCDECHHRMVNVDAKDMRPGDLVKLKAASVRISNPETDKEVCLECDPPSWRQAFNDWYSAPVSDDDDDDSSFFSGGSFFGGSSSSGGSSFGGFGGGSFSGGGASGGW